VGKGFVEGRAPDPDLGCRFGWRQTGIDQGDATSSFSGRSGLRPGRQPFATAAARPSRVRSAISRHSKRAIGAEPVENELTDGGRGINLLQTRPQITSAKRLPSTNKIDLC
jgi:hypothetical protein